MLLPRRLGAGPKAGLGARKRSNETFHVPQVPGVLDPGASSFPLCSSCVPSEIRPGVPKVRRRRVGGDAGSDWVGRKPSPAPAPGWRRGTAVWSSYLFTYSSIYLFTSRALCMGRFGPARREADWHVVGRRFKPQTHLGWASGDLSSAPRLAPGLVALTSAYS